MQNLTEKELVVLAQNRNDRAFDKLMSTYRPKMLNIMSNKFKKYSRIDVEDMIQDAMFKAYKNIGKYNPTHTFMTWFSKICVNTIIDHGRLVSSRMKDSSVSMDFKTSEQDGTEIKNLIPSNSLNPQESLERQNKADLALNLLCSNKLSDSIKIVAEMRYLDELSYEEISKRVGMPLGTVKAQLHRFRKVSAKIISKEMYESTY